jgi:hypothetical protein
MLEKYTKTSYYPLAALIILQSLFAQTPARSIDGVWQGALLFGQGKVRVVLYVRLGGMGVGRIISTTVAHT